MPRHIPPALLHLDFRISPVDDPVAFFLQLKNPNQVGGPPPTIGGASAGAAAIA